MEQGKAQHRGKQTGTTAFPERFLLFSFAEASYWYLAFDFSQPP